MMHYVAGKPRIERHIIDTYFYLRLGMGLLALAFPLVLSLGGFFLDIPLQESMSDYYHTGMRNIFVGVLFAIAFSLWRYKGFTKKEDRALDLAAFLAIGVALFPTGADWSLGNSIDCSQKEMVALCSYLEQRFKPYTNSIPHGICAILFFASIAYVCWFRAGDTLYLMDQERQRTYKAFYKAMGVWMVVASAVAGALLMFLHVSLPGSKNYTVFVVELSAIWAFAFYWLGKTREMHQTNADTCYTPPEMRSVPKATPADLIKPSWDKT